MCENQKIVTKGQKCSAEDEATIAQATQRAKMRSLSLQEGADLYPHVARRIAGGCHPADQTAPGSPLSGE